MMCGKSSNDATESLKTVAEAKMMLLSRSEPSGRQKYMQRENKAVGLGLFNSLKLRGREDCFDLLS